MRILVTGSNGLLGQKLVAGLLKDNHIVCGLDLQESSYLEYSSIEYQKVNITSRRETSDRVKNWKPEVIVHCAAMTAVDACETEREMCWKVNVDGTENICIAASKVEAKVIYISTDYVFDGESGPYSEEDTPNPGGYYAKSKLAGENVVRGSGNNPTVIRSIVIYGFGKNIKSSFVTWLVGELRSGRKVRIVDDQWGNSTIADDLANAIGRLIKLEKHGLYHMGGSSFITRFEMATRIARFFELDESLITPITTAELKQPAKRPLRSGLLINKAESELSYNFLDLEQSLQLYKSCEQ